MVAQFCVVSGLDFITIVIVIIIMSNFLVVLGCSDDDSVSISSLTLPVMSVEGHPCLVLLMNQSPCKRDRNCW